MVDKAAPPPNEDEVEPGMEEAFIDEEGVEVLDDLEGMCAALVQRGRARHADENKAGKIIMTTPPRNKSQPLPFSPSHRHYRHAGGQQRRGRRRRG